jgi:ATPase subunit of ABC transporter with duplicated ATPase domains
MAEELTRMRASRAAMVISHDRHFLERICTRVVDLPQ